MQYQTLRSVSDNHVHVAVLVSAWCLL